MLVEINMIGLHYCEGSNFLRETSECVSKKNDRAVCPNGCANNKSCTIAYLLPVLPTQLARFVVIVTLGH